MLYEKISHSLLLLSLSPVGITGSTTLKRQLFSTLLCCGACSYRTGWKRASTGASIISIIGELGSFELLGMDLVCCVENFSQCSSVKRISAIRT